MTDRINSHPDLYLQQHIEQMQTALLKGILPWHSDKVLNARIINLVKKAIVYHDLGKSTQAFQEYIQDPLNYRGNPKDKSHSPLSTLLTLYGAHKRDWPQLDTLLLAAIIKGHHNRLPTIPQNKLGSIDCPQWDIDNFAGGETPRLLRKQLKTISFNALQLETGLEFGKEGFKDTDLGEHIQINKLKNYLTGTINKLFWTMSEETAVEFRLETQLVYSLLLEVDRAFLALTNQEYYLARSEKAWEADWIEKRLANAPTNFINGLRQKARGKVIAMVNTDEFNAAGGLYSLTVPTGIGKTLLAATWALKMREKTEGKSKIIIVLPFLSVIEQTAREYVKLLEIVGHEVDGTWLLKSHSLSDRNYSISLEEQDETFFIDTWRSEIIITTYDQFLMNLMEPNAKYQMRFHNLCDAIIVMDEVQSLPCKLWKPLDKILNGLAKVGNSKVLLMSATLPPFVNNTQSLIVDYQEFFKMFKRYRIKLTLDNSMDIEEFSKQLIKKLHIWVKERQRILITLNTRQSARDVRDALHNALENKWPNEYQQTSLLFLSADVTPIDRMGAIEIIKENKACIVVSTQCIEAGVDIDMDEVYRDFAPLDSIIQIAGRCNREWENNDRKNVTVVDLVNKNGNKYSQMIYDPIHLAVTRELIGKRQEILEEDILAITIDYFLSLAGKKDLGDDNLTKFAYWQDNVPVREMLRGKELEQYTFLVIEQDIGLKEAMETVSKIEDKWERKESWRKLAGRIAKVSINVLAKKGFHPGWIAEPFLDYWLVKEGYYDSTCGLKINLEQSVVVL